MITEFAEALKRRLRDREFMQQSRDTNGGYEYVDWDELDRQINELCAEFKARQVKP